MLRNPPEVNYRAIRDMGLAAWWGASLMGLSGLTSASEAHQDPAERHRVYDAGWRGSRGLLTGSITAYVLGTSLVRFDGKPLDSDGKPRWIDEGVESVPRTLALGGALAAAIAAKRLRAKEGKIYEQAGVPTPAELAEAGELRRRAKTFHVLVPVLLGWLTYSHLKEDAQD